MFSLNSLYISIHLSLCHFSLSPNLIFFFFFFFFLPHYANSGLSHGFFSKDCHHILMADCSGGEDALSVTLIRAPPINSLPCMVFQTAENEQSLFLFVAFFSASKYHGDIFFYFSVLYLVSIHV